MDTPQTRTKRRAGLTGMALVAVIGIGSLAGSNTARDDLTPKAYKALVDAGLSNVKVDFDGREAKLSNGTPEELAKAENIVEGVNGVRSASIDTDRGASLAKPPTLSISRSGGDINLSGVVPNAEVAARLKSAAASSFGTVIGSLKVDSTVGTAEWLTTLPTLFPGVADVNNLTLSIDGDSLSLGGSLESQADIDALAGLVEPSIGQLSFDSTLRVAPPDADSVAAPRERADHTNFVKGI